MLEPPNGSGRPFVFMGLERCAVNAVFGNVELLPPLLLVFVFLLLPEPFDNRNLVELMEDALLDEGVPVSLPLEEL